MSFHLLACISSHGYGHFAMTAPILNELNKQDSISLTVRCALPEALIRSRIGGDFNIVAESSDFGMIMNSSLDVDLEAAEKAYQALHENFPQAITDEKEKLIALKPNLIIANIPYLTVAAAHQAKIPVIAYCSLNWGEIFKSYFEGKFPEAKKILTDINDAYNLADFFVCPEPSMAMPDLKNIKHIGPVAKVATSHRKLLNEQFSLSDEHKLVLITPGGVATPVPVNDWPVIPGVTWITAWSYETTRQDIISMEQIKLLFSDLLASCDAVITKPGYGTVTETVCNGIPVLYVLRGDWAEEPFLEAWWHNHGTVIKISREDFFAGNLQENLAKLWALPSPKPIVPTGTQALLSLVKTYIPE